MTQLFALLAILTGMLIICLFTTKRVLISPQFGFIACFIPGIIYAFAYVEKWDLSLAPMTIWVFFIGTLTFLVVSFICSRFDGLFRKTIVEIRFKQLKNEYLSVWKFYGIIVLESLTLFLTLHFLLKNYGNSLSNAMFAYRRVSTSTEDHIILPSIVKASRKTCIASGFVTSYIYVRGIVYKNRQYSRLSLICLILSLLNGMSLGARGDAIQILVAASIQYLIIYTIKTGGKPIKLSSFLKIFALIAAIVLSFAKIGELMGRNMSFLGKDYIAVYLSAELKNLDTFVRGENFGAPFSDFQTMASISKFLATISGNPSIEHKLTNPFRYINGYALGNVSTTFYGFLYDMGVFGVFFFTTIMAIICHRFYYKAINARPQNEISISIIIYSYIWYTVIFSFFSDKFYEMIFNTAFLWFVVGVVIVKAWFQLSFKTNTFQ